MEVTFLYFSWIRETVGKKSEVITIPASVNTLVQLIEWQKDRGENYRLAFENKNKEIRIAVDHKYVKITSTLNKPKEIAFFPPVTGG
jgi:molybdopterin synthase sulfur carrier subunit